MLAPAADSVQWVYDFLNEQPGLVAYVALTVLLSVPLLLIHELGHAAAAKLLGARDVFVLAGGASPGVERNIAGIPTRVTPAARPWRFDGLMTFDPTGISHFGVTLIALAGPLASFAAAALTGLLMGERNPGSLLDDALAVATLNGCLGGIVSLLPITVTDSVDPARPALALDGRVALDAFRMARGRPPGITTATERRGHMGPVGWWSVVALGVIPILLIAVMPATDPEPVAFVICGAVAGLGLWGLARTSGRRERS